MKRLIVSTIIFLSACQTSGPKNIDLSFDDWDAAKPGTVVSQSSVALKDGFYEVAKSRVNPRGHWEGVGHFSFIYFGKTEICRCSSYDTAISPNGHYIVYHSNENDRLEVFNTRSKIVSHLSDKYVGRPNKAEWDINGKFAIIYLTGKSDEITTKIKISLG